MQLFKHKPSGNLFTGLLHDGSKESAMAILELCNGMGLTLVEVDGDYILLIPNSCLTVQSGYWAMRGEGSLQIISNSHRDNFIPVDRSIGMLYHEQEDAFDNELDILITRYSHEFDLTASSIVGILQAAIHDILNTEQYEKEDK